MSDKKRIAILGATGYGGGELLRLLLRHPQATVLYATSRSAAGLVSQVHRNLDGLTTLEFSNPVEEEIAENCEVIFGALPHGSAAKVLAPFVDRGKLVIDLSGDFRLKDIGEYQKWYKTEHPRPDLLAWAVYGCPEIHAAEIEQARLVASPGCFATAINLALLPAAQAGLLASLADVVAMTGSSGSGAEAKAGTHHPIRAGTLRPYKVLNHQHVPECVQTLRSAGSETFETISFTPVSAPIVRGILAIATAELSKSLTTHEAEALYAESYANAPYVKTLTEREPECASVAGTNFAEVRVRIDPQGRLHAVCALDNLVKGGAGQAVESFDIITSGRHMARPPLDWPGMWP